MAKSKVSKIDISLTDFVDFVCKSGSAKLTKVKEIKKRDKYSPAKDFYKGLREGIIQNHLKKGDKKNLDKILDDITDSKKEKNYRESVEGYQRFWGRKKIEYFEPPYRHWITGDVDVRINPELGLIYDRKSYVIKLYLKSEKLKKDKIDQILTLMESELRESINLDVIMGILDIKNSKLFTKDNDDISLLPLLEGEVKSFEIIWKGI